MTMDRIGRKPFLLWGSVGMFLTLATVGFAFSQGSLVDGSLQLPGKMGLVLVGIGLAAAYGIYAFFAFISIFFIWKFVNETKGKELEEMEG